MENSRKVAREKRGYEESVEEEAIHPQSKKSTNVPALASVIVEALKVDSLQKFCSSLEPLFRKIVSEELERALTKLGHAKLAGRSSHQRIVGPEGRKLHLHFKSKLPPHLFTGGKVEGEQGAAIHVVLLDKNTGCIVQMGPESGAKLNVVVLEGDFNDEPDDDWTQEHFESYEVKERDGKRPLLNGETQMILKEGIGTLGDLIFTDNSSWIRSRKFRLGVKIASGFCDGIRVREAKTEAFAVKDHRGELYKKHYPPELHDEVWRLERIAKDGALHKKLITAKISTVEDFLRLLVRDPQSLRNVLGSGMSNRMWDNTVEHAKTCDLGGKLYVYYTDETRSIGAVFNHIYELRGLITDEHFLSMESLSHNQKVSVDSLVNQAYNNWNHVVEYDSKFLLNSLNSRSKKGMEALSAARAVSKPSTDHYFLHPEEHTQLHVSYNCQPSAHQLIEFPFTILNPRDPPQAAFTSNLDNPSYHSGDWSRSRNEQGLGEIFSSEIRLRSSEMLENDDMQQLLKTFNTGVGVGIGAAFSHSDESCYGYNTRYERGRSSGKAVVSWLKLKAALRWGIFIRKRAAEKRAQLVELD